MKIEVILVINFNRMDKATGQWKFAEMLGMFGNMTIRIMEYGVHGQPKYYTLEVSYEMFTADMHSFIFIIIYIGSQIMHICIYSISNIQCIFKNGDIYMRWYLSHRQHQAALCKLIKLSKPQYYLIWATL